MCYATRRTKNFCKDWTERLGKKRTHDAVAVANDGVLNTIDCTILEADAKGENLSFKLKAGNTEVSRPLAGFTGFIFQRTLNPNAPPVVCQLGGRRPQQPPWSPPARRRSRTVSKLTTSAGVTIGYQTKQLVLPRLQFGEPCVLTVRFDTEQCRRDFDRGRTQLLSRLSQGLQPGRLAAPPARAAVHKRHRAAFAHRAGVQAQGRIPHVPGPGRH